MVSLPINFRNKSFIGNRRPFLLNTLKQPPFGVQVVLPVPQAAAGCTASIPFFI